MKIQCIHFDLDSVLYLPSDFLQSALRLSVQAMIQYGLKADPQEALDVLLAIRSEDSNAADHFNRLVEHFNGEYDPVIIAAGVEKYWDSKQSNMLCTANAFSVLRILSRKYPLTIVTNGIPVKQAGKLIRLGLCQFFIDFDPLSGLGRKRIYATARANEMKPFPFLWERAQGELKFDYHRCLMIGDRYWADIFGAKRLGMTTIKITQGEHRHESKEKALQRGMSKPQHLSGNPETILLQMEPDYIIADLIELLAIVEQIEAA
jgi:putative hydrolase of the HAD superfamily